MGPEAFINNLGSLTPAVPLIIAGLFAGFLPYYGRKALMLLAPVLAMVMLFGTDFGMHGAYSFAGIELVSFRLDALSRIWGVVFILAAFLNAIYALHERDRLSDSMGLLYAGSAVGAVFAGDFLTLFFFWEITAISSVFLIWQSRTKASYGAGLRYLAFHIASGVLLLAGAVLHGRETGSFAFNSLTLSSLSSWLIFIAFGIKCAFPLLHNWLQDSYPKATVTGAVTLSAFTTKLAVYALARGFAGESLLIYIGLTMTLFPVFFALIENDLRKVLAYSLNNQLGFMVTGIGIGSALALNGVAAHAFCHILYKALLFMSMGAVLHRTGTVKASELGGLFRTMPLTAVFCVIGAASISAFPLFSGFVSKSMILAAAMKEHLWGVWLVLLLASAGVLEHSGIKIPYFAFWGHDSGKRPKEAPWNMLLAMGLVAFLCLYLAWPWGGYQTLYKLLPFSMGSAFQPYTYDHVLEQMQLLIAASFAFAFLMRVKLYPPERPAQILDTDWIYRHVGYKFSLWLYAMLTRLSAHIQYGFSRVLKVAGQKLYAMCSPSGALSEAFPTGAAAIWAALLLGATLMLAYFIVG